MRALVTGGGGFIGSNLVEALLKAGADVAVIDDFSTGRRQNLDHAPRWAQEGGGRFALQEGDIRDRDAVGRAVQGREVIFHFAALPSVARSVEDPLSSHQVNVDGTLNLLLAARDGGVLRLVLSSSSSVYGESEALPKVETMAPAPISPYALDKLSGEIYCRLFSRLYGFSTVALRYFNVFGPRQNPASEYAAVIPRFVTAALTGGEATIFGTGQQTRDFTYVDNVVEANLCAARAPSSCSGEAFNVACGDRISLLELIDRIGRIVGVKVAVRHLDPRAGDIQHSLAGIDKAKGALNYKPLVTFDEGLARTIDWYRSA